MKLNTNIIINNYNIDDNVYSKFYDYFNTEYENHLKFNENIINEDIVNCINNDIHKLTNNIENINSIELINIFDRIKDKFDINAVDEILSILKLIKVNEICIPKYFIVLTITYNDVIVAYISLIYDNRTKLIDLKTQELRSVLFFIGISKSLSFYITQELNYFKSIKIVDLIIPIIQKIGTIYKCDYISTIPLGFMNNILVNKFGFMNDSKYGFINEYYAPCLLLHDNEYEIITYKKI